MQKRVFTYLIITLLTISYFSILTFAQENSTEETQIRTEEQTASENPEKNDASKELEQEFQNAELEQSAGTTPDSAFYAIDNFFDENFGDPVKVREEKIAELQKMTEEGKEEEAKEALDAYKKYAEKFENDADPAKREEARRSSAAIRIASKEFNKEFSTEILEKESSLITAVEISSKIKELCTQLANLDPEEFYKNCKTEDNSQKWQKDLFDDLTAKQKEEAEQFINVISECFEENPANCKCEESTNIQSFVEQCKIISEAEAKCRLGDDTACEVSSEAESKIYDSLASAPHLLKALQLIESRSNQFQNDRFEDHMPPECEEAGATSPDRM